MKKSSRSSELSPLGDCERSKYVGLLKFYVFMFHVNALLRQLNGSKPFRERQGIDIVSEHEPEENTLVNEDIAAYRMHRHHLP